MQNLTDRQSQLLKAICEEFIATALPVGSEILEKKAHLGVSPATIRNEMVKLTSLGYLRQNHASSGRTPTPMALKFYVKTLMRLKKMPVVDEVGIKQQVWDFRKDTGKLLQEATKALAQKTHALALMVTDEDLYYCGAANILDMPEFYDIELTKTVLSMLDSFDFWHNLFARGFDIDEPIKIIMGEDLEEPNLSPYSFVYANFVFKESKGSIGVMGPTRLNFPLIVPYVNYIGNLLNQFGE